MNLYTLFCYLMIYSFLGWLCESIYVSICRHKIINSGFMNGPFCPIYGFGATGVIVFLTPFITHPTLVFILGILLTSTLEYFTSWLMEVLFHTRWWDYSHFKYHLNGRICLLNSFLFGIMAIFVMYVLHPYIAANVLLIPLNTIKVIDALLLIYLFIDMTSSITQLVTFRQSAARFEKAVASIKLKISEINPEFSVNELHEHLENIMTSKDEQLEELRKRLNEYYLELEHKRTHLHKAFPDLKLSSKKLLVSRIYDYFKEHENN